MKENVSIVSTINIIVYLIKENGLWLLTQKMVVGVDYAILHWIPFSSIFINILLRIDEMKIVVSRKINDH